MKTRKTGKIKCELLEVPETIAKETIIRSVADTATSNKINNPLEYAYWVGYLEGALWLYFALRNNAIKPIKPLADAAEELL